MSELRELEALFQQAADLPAEERAAFLDREVADPPLRARLEAMLDDLEAGDTLLSPADGSPDDDDRDAHRERLAGQLIADRYRLLERIGEGGFGVVYRAEQQRPVRRQVAVKVVKIGMDSREVVARFEAERQALALMDHPSIAKVLDGGVTGPDDPAAGRPYFVMELVKGLPITDYCRREQLSLPRRLRLFLAVCGAVQHAHQKGIIHRDLKPSNVLVTILDGEPVPKVIDFGVAKAMHGRLTDKTLYTAFHRLVGTPAYMSPEQAESSPLDIDTRSDVYALGVLLYELLTGATPFPAERLLAAGPAELQRILRHEQPPRPSHRLRAQRSDGDAAAAGGVGGGGGAEGARQLAGDLDWIVMKALEKERARRYATADALADDLRRHLTDEPVLARPPSRSYRLKKALLRHRAAVASAALVLLALLGGVIGTGIGLIEASHQRDSARQEAERARSVTEFLLGTLSLADLEVMLEPELSVRLVLDRAAARVDGAFAGQPVAEARVRATLGQAYESLGENAQAAHQLRRAVELSDRWAAGAPADAAILDAGALDGRELYDTLWALTHVLFKLERPDAQEVAHRARRVAHALVARRHPELGRQLDAYIEEIRSGIHIPDDAPVRRATRLLEEALMRAEGELAPGDPLWPLLADSCMDGAYTLWYTVHEAAAEPLLRHAVAIRRRELPPQHADTGEAVSLLAGVLTRAGRPGEAEEPLRAALDRLIEVFPEDGFQVAFAQAALGENLTAQRRFAEAEPLLLASHRVLIEVSDRQATFFPIDSYGRLIRLYDGWGRQELAAPHRLALAELIASADWPVVWTFSHVVLGPEEAELHTVMAGLEERLGGWEYTVTGGGLAETAADGELLAAVERTVALQRRLLPAGDPRRRAVARMLMGWANALAPGGAAIGDVAGDGAVPGPVRRRLAEASLAELAPLGRETPLEVAEAHTVLALADSGDRRAHVERAIALLGEAELADSWFTANVKARIARDLMAAGRRAEAEELLQAVRQVLSVQLGPTNRDLQAVEALLASAAAPS